jgi:hypothetical protein
LNKEYKGIDSAEAARVVREESARINRSGLGMKYPDMLTREDGAIRADIKAALRADSQRYERGDTTPPPRTPAKANETPRQTLDRLQRDDERMAAYNHAGPGKELDPHGREIDVRQANLVLKSEIPGTAAHRRAQAAYGRAQAVYDKAFGAAQKAQDAALARITGQAAGTRQRSGGSARTSTSRTKAPSPEKLTAKLAQMWQNQARHSSSSLDANSAHALGRYLMATQPSWAIGLPRPSELSVSTPDGVTHELRAWSDVKSFFETYAPDSLAQLTAAARTQVATRTRGAA